MKISSVRIYTSLMSPFGWAFLHELLQNKNLIVREVVVASLDLWWDFHCRLRGESTQVLPLRVNERYAQRYQQLEKQLPTSTEIRIIHSANTTEEIKRIKPDEFIFCAAFPEIFQAELCTAVSPGIVNFHPSYLPRCRGAHPIYWTIAKQESYGGLSSHIMVEKIDAGPIIYREKIHFDATTITYDALFELVCGSMDLVITNTVENLRQGKLLSQDAISEQVSYHKNDREEDHKVNWEHDTFPVISAKIRAGQCFSMISESEKILLQPPVKEVNRKEVESYLVVVEGGVSKSTGVSGPIVHRSRASVVWQSSNGVFFQCCLVPTSYSIWQRLLLKLLRWSPNLRSRFRQWVAERLLRAYYL